MSSSSDGGSGDCSRFSSRRMSVEEQDEQFFETMEEIASTSASSDGGSDGEFFRFNHRQQRHRGPADLPRDAKYAVWTSDPSSIGERRLKFFSKMGIELSRDCNSSSSPPRPPSGPRSTSPIGEFGDHRDQRSDNQGIKDLPSISHGVFSSTDSLNSSVAPDDGSRDENTEESGSSNSNREFLCRIKDLDNGKEFIVHELGSDGLWNKLREVGTGKEFSLEEFESALGLSPLVQMQEQQQQQQQQQQPAVVHSFKHKRRSWLRMIRGAVRRTPHESQHKDDSSQLSNSSSSRSSPWRMQRVKVRISKKSVRELTELFMGQELQGHQGPIWALKFSSGGRFLASGGQDCIVRVWEVVIESAPPSETVEANHLPLPLPPNPKKASKKRSTSGKKRHGTVDRVGIKTFSLVERCVLHGHAEDILDLAWSPSEQFLLSASMDKTVRLWHVEREECLRIFPHSDYVTCVVFNPADERFFLSGSLDGKVRIWSILDHHVVDWTVVRDMVSAAAYTPDGLGAIIGTLKGVCRFYKTTENKLEPNGNMEVVPYKGKKDSRKITGIQCMSGEPSKVLVTSNDSRVRLFDGTELISKYKGFRILSSQIAASFSRNGSFIISASEDSHVYVWNVHPPSTASCRGHLQISEKSCESFFSDNVTAAVPWPSQPDEGRDKAAADNRKDIHSRALKIGTELLKQLQLLKQTSFAGPCFDCLTVADSTTDGGSTTVFPVSDDASSATDNMDGVSLSPNSLSGLMSSDSKWPEKKMEAAPLLLNSSDAAQKEASSGAKALGLVIVTASSTGEIRTFQNYGLPLHA